MNQQDKLRDTLREYYDTQQVPFNDNEWERASAYISAARRGRRIRSAVLILAALVSTLVIALLNFPKLTNDDGHKALSRSDQMLKSAPASQSAVPPAPMPKESKTAINSLSKPTMESTPAAISAPESRRNTPQIQAGSRSGKASKIFESSITKSGSDPVEQGNPVNEGSVMDNNPAAALSNVMQTFQVFAAPAQEPERSYHVENSTAIDNHEQDDIMQKMPGDSKENAEPVPVALENSAHGQDQPRTKETPQVPIDFLPQTATTTVSLNDNKKESAGRDDTKFNDPEEKTHTPMDEAFPDAPYADTTPTLNVSRGDSLPKPLLNLAGEGIFYEAGAAWCYGWKGPVNRDARGFSPVAGISYMNRLGNRYSLSFGIQYLQLRNLSNGSKTSRVSDYRYGEQSRVTVITPLTVHYLVAPLRFHYFKDRRNCLGGGINLAYLLNVDATVTSYDEKPGGSHENYETVKLGGYTQGFSWFDSQLAFFYRRRIGNSLGLQAEVFLGLTDVKQDGFFGFSNKERNSGMKLSLVYYAFRKNSKR